MTTTPASMGEPPSEADRLAEILTRVENLVYNTPPWASEYDDLGTDINFGAHYQVNDADGDLVAVAENEPIVQLLLHGPADLEYLLRRMKLTMRAYEDAKETRDKNAQRVIGWREQCSLATRERDAALVEARQIQERLDTANARVGVLEGQLATAEETIRDAAHIAICEMSVEHCIDNRGRCVRAAEAAARALGLDGGGTDE